jgi:pimeloyl-ACP methyl ester carboxylesterase|tara:strand:+ start:1628 stop:2389 length:762 start_codon:yes stop_codon:yes gene_type:complete
VKLNYKSFGSGEPLVILHGLMGMLDNWQSLAKDYAEHFEVYIIDARNHGHSPHSSEMNYEVMMHDLLEFCHEHDLSEIHLLGHSMGGKTAMKFAQNFADFVSKLIIADIAPVSYPIRHDIILKGLESLNFDTIKSRGEAERLLENYIPEIGVRQFILKSSYWVGKGKLALRFNLKAIRENIEIIGEETTDAMFEKETLFIRGENSNYILNKYQELIDEYFPKNRILTFPNSGHWLHAEQPKMFLEETLKFLLK